MSLQVSAVPHSWMVAEDFLSLEHWHEWGTTDREHELRPDSAVGSGNALWMGDTGGFRIARDTHIPPGAAVAVSWWAFQHPGGGGPVGVQLREQTASGDGGQQVTLIGSAGGALAPGWNRCIARDIAPEEWAGVRISLFNSTQPGGLIAQLRVTPADEEEE